MKKKYQKENADSSLLDLSGLERTDYASTKIC